MPNGTFFGPKLKTKRAKRHISDLDREIRSFLDRKPYRVVVESDAHREQYRIVFRVREEMPSDFSTYIGDAIHNLRSSLDFLACDLVRLNGQSANGVYFPFAEDANNLEKAIKDKKVKRASPDVVDIIRRLKPYKGGNPPLRALHELDIMDKHKLFIPVVQIANIPSFSMITANSSMHVAAGMVFFAPDDGKILAFSPPTRNLKIGDELKPTIVISFDEGQPFEREAVIPTLHQLVNLAEGIVQTFEAHCFGERPP